jgi:hypothetical protein
MCVWPNQSPPLIALQRIYIDRDNHDPIVCIHGCAWAGTKNDQTVRRYDDTATTIRVNEEKRIGHIKMSQ